MALSGIAELEPEQIVRLEEDGPAVVLLDQRRLPEEVAEVRCTTAAEVPDAITEMAHRLNVSKQDVVVALLNEGLTAAGGRLIADVESGRRNRPAAIFQRMQSQIEDGASE